MKNVNELIPKGYFDEHKIVDGTAAGVLVDMAVSDLILFPEEKMPDLELSEEEAALAEEVVASMIRVQQNEKTQEA